MKRRLITIITVMVMAFTIFGLTPEKASASSSKYWIKVNTKANVVNVYKKVDGKWKPWRAMLCSTGKSSTPTIIGNYSVKKKWRWKVLMKSSAQYISQFSGNYLLHSDIYKTNHKGSSCQRSAYNKLGHDASHGCVRMAVIDAKWIYKNCGRGTKVTTYKSSNPGPLGKPSRVKMLGSGTYGWDPTDPNAPSKYFNLHGPKITIKKASEVEYGQAFDIKKGVTAKNIYCNQDLTWRVKVDKVQYSAYEPEADQDADGTATGTGREFVTLSDKKVDTSKPGTYRITYSCYHSYAGKKSTKATFELTVLPEPADEPTLNEEESEPEQPAQTENPAEIGDDNNAENNEITDQIVNSGSEL